MPAGRNNGDVGFAAQGTLANAVSDRRGGQRAYLVAAVVFAAALIRIGAVVVHNPGELLYSDMANYDAVAEHIRHGRMSASDTFHPIGYPGFLAVIYALTDRNFVVVAVVQALLGTATCWLVAILTWRLSPSTTASVVAAAAAALYPPFVYHGAMLLTESIAPFLVHAIGLVHSPSY